MSKPNPTKIWEDCNALVDRDAKRSQMYDRMDNLYFMANKKTSPDPKVQYLTMPYATSVIDLITDLAAQMAFAISVPAAGEERTDQRDAENLENWLRAWLSKNGKQQQRNHISEAAFLAAQRAQCIGRTLFVEKSITTAADPQEDDTVAGLPVIFQLRDPRHVHVADGPLGARCVVERYQREAGDVRTLYPKAVDPKLGDTDMVEWTEWWTPLYRCYFVNDVPVRTPGGPVVTHGYGCIPYSFGNARSLPFPEGEKRYRPVLIAVEDLAAVIDTWFSINATAGLAAITNAWAVYSDTLSADNGKPLDLEPGQVNYLGTADKVQALQRAGMPPDFFQLGTLLFQAWQSETFPFNLFGQSPGDVAGYAISLLSQAGRRIILPVWRAVEDMLAGAMLNCVTICAHKVAPRTGNKIPLVITTQDSPSARPVKRSLRLDVSKFGDDLDLTVSLADPMPQDVASNIRMALESTKGGLLSNATALEKFKISSEPNAEMERIATEAIYKQLAPIEGLKLAIARGYAPAQVTIPEGFGVGPDGTLVPQALLDAIKGAQQAEQGGPPPSAPPQMPQQMPQPVMQAPPQMAAGPQQMPQLDPAMLQQLMQMIQAGMLPMPTATGEPTGQPNVTDMQALSGGAIEPQMDDLAPGVPRARMPGGF